MGVAAGELLRPLPDGRLRATFAGTDIGQHPTGEQSRHGPQRRRHRPPVHHRGVAGHHMDDVTSGFNIGKNISLHPDFNKMVGFTAEEVRHLVETYRERGAFD
ncbi:MAG: AAA family ATPase [Spirochaetaceae bacterium]|nr:AAA family ATPase [Spirochaetaceae bacterium]